MNGVRSFDASQRRPPLAMAPCTGDASQRTPLSGGSWGAAAAAVAATRAAALSVPTTNTALTSTCTGAYPLSAADAVALGRIAQSAADKQIPLEQIAQAVAAVSSPGPPMAEDTFLCSQAAGATPGDREVGPTDPVKCWLAGMSGGCIPSEEDLVQRLRAALPETYDD